MLMAALLGSPLLMIAQTESEPNDNLGQANTLTLGTARSGDMGPAPCASGVSDDYYALNLVNDGTITINTNATVVSGSPGTIRIYGYNSGGGQIFSDDHTTGVSGTFSSVSSIRTCLSKGTYYFLLQRLNGDCYNYDFTVTQGAPVHSDDLEPNNNFTQADANPLLAANTNSDGHLNFSHYGDNDDRYKLQTSGDGDLTVTISAESPGAASAVRVYLYNSGGGQINSFDATVGANGVPVGTNATFTCYGAGVYYILVQSLGACGVSYRLSHSLTPTVFSNDVEPNNLFGSALALNHNAYMQGHLNFSHYGDNDDRYALTTPVEGTINVQLIAENAAGGTVRVYLYEGNGGQINSFDASVGSNHDDDTTSASFDCYGQGNYYFLVQSLSGCGISYKLKYQSTGAVYANDVEPNNNFTQAAANGVLAHNTFTEGHINFSYYGDNDDRYFLQTPAEGTMRLTMIAERVPAAAGTLRIYVYNGGGGQINSFDASAGGSNDDDTTSAEFTCYGQGDYYLQVQSIGGCGISYKLKYETLPAMYANDSEPNNSFPTALPLATSTYTEGHINFTHYGDNDDRYVIQTASDGEVTLNMIAERVPASDGTLRIYVYNSGGGQINSFDATAGGNNDDDTTSATFSCYGGGTYYLLVQSIDGCGISYKLRYDLAPAVFANDPGANNSFPTAVILNPDSATATGHLNFTHIGDDNDDRYRVVLPSAGNMSFDFEAENAAGSTVRIYLYNSGGGQITSFDAAVGAGHTPTSTAVSFNGLASGTYYLLLQSIVGCGISYAINCNDNDNDGTCNYFDLCPGGPEPGTPCDDGSACTVGDMITLACTCAGEAILCDDNDPCTTDSCNPLSGCVFTPSPDTDNDGTCDLTDGCPNDANKTSPGNCGCGNPEPGALCNDNNPLTINDVIGGNCLCAGTPVSCTGNGDCNDNDPCTSDACDNNVCVFTPLPDGDGDGTCDAQDGCPADPNKTAPGICGCGVSDVDTDSDGTADCNDGCPNDANKTAPGICGCGVSDVDTDSDGTADCNDGCPNDANKTTPGICGCGVSDADTDSDGTVDCNDGCPNDASKIAPGICGCGVSDADTDSDGTADCNDGCPNDASKTSPGTCGCGNPEPGATCDDGNANTINDVIGTNCLCAGTPIGGCQPTQLTTTPNPVVTCGIINVKLDGTTTLWADEVPGANRYQYLFTNISGQPVYSRSIAGPTRSRQLFQWYTTPLKAGRTYRVQVRASFDGGNTWCPYGQFCTIRISNQPNPLFRDLEQGEDLSDATTAEPTLSLLPNPVRDGRVMLLIDGLSTVPGHVAHIEVFDTMGRSVLNDQVSQANLASGQLLDLQGQGKGLYLVQVSLNDERFVERLILH